MLPSTGDAIDGGAPESLLLLVSLTPRSYSDTIGQVIGDLRPGVAVRVVEPEELADEVSRLRPNMVLCSQPYEVGETGARWVEYYPYAEPPEEEIRIDGRGSGQRAVDLTDLLALVDRSLAST